MTEVEQLACFAVTRSWDDLGEGPDRIAPNEDET